ncbi:MAG: hypothetical protein SHS37scaffold537_14 [Phage 68_12]|nr:MAG: hypothetical protein SHS37scaffold537_14 [Phage 68_12]
MDSLQQFFGLVGPIIGVIGAVAAIVVYLKTAIDKGTIEAMRRNADALRDRVLLLETADTTKTARIEALERENQILAAVPSSAGAIEALATQLSQHHTETMRILEGER